MKRKTKTVPVMLCIVRLCKQCKARNGRHSKNSDNTLLVEIPIEGMPDLTPETLETMKREDKDLIFPYRETGMWICPNCKKRVIEELSLELKDAYNKLFLKSLLRDKPISGDQ